MTNNPPRPNRKKPTLTAVSAFLVAAIVASLATPALACSVPVFRYGLERWPADAYQVFVLHDKQLTADEAKAVKTLSDAHVDDELYANVWTIDVDLRDEQKLGEAAEAYRKLWNRVKDKGDGGAVMLVRYPLAGPFMRGPFPAEEYREDEILAEYDVVFTGRLTSANIASLLESPVRTEIARRILKGDSAVWIFVESGDREADAKKLAELKKTLAEAEKTIPLPEIEERDMERYVSASGPPLKVAFSVVTLKHGDEKEAMLRAMLKGMPQIEHGEPELWVKDKPMTYAVFSRGRAIGPLGSDDLPMDRDTVLDLSAFICGSCSCEIKHQNPGVDLLFRAGWENFIIGALVVDEALPALVGLPDAKQLAALSADPMISDAPTTQPADSDATAKADAAPVTAAVPGVGGSAGAIGRNVLVTVIVAIGVIAAIAFVIGLMRGEDR